MRLFYHTLCFCYLPLLIICIIFYFTYYKNVEEKTLSFQHENLNKAVASFEWELNAAEDISNQLAENPTIRRLYLDEGQFFSESTLLRQTLEALCSTSSIVDNIYLKCAGERWIYGRQGTVVTQFYTADENYNAPNVFTYNGQDFSSITYASENINHFLYITKEYHPGCGVDRQMLLYSSPVYYQNNEISLLSVIEINMESVFACLEEGVQMYDGTILMILDESRELLYSSQEADYPLDEIREMSTRKCRIDGTAYYLQRVDFPFLGWDIVLLTETSQLPSAFGADMKVSLVLLIMLLLGSAFLMAHFINCNYAPLHEIYQIAQQYYIQMTDGTAPHPADSDRKDEFQLIHSALENMHDRVIRLSALQENYSGLLQKEFWTDVMNRRIGSQEELYKRAKELNIPTENRVWCVALTEYAVNPESSYELYQKILNDYHLNAELFLLHSAYAGRHICIISFAADSDLQLRDFEHFCYCTIAEMNHAMLMGVGRLVNDLDHIVQSSFEATTALDFCHLTGRKVVLFENIDPHFITLQNPIIDLIGAFQQSIQEENTLALSDVFNSFQKLLIQHDLALHSLRHMCFDLYNVAIDTLNAMQKKTSQLTKSGFLDAVMNMQFQDEAVDLVEDLEELITECLCPFYKPSMGEVLDNLREQRRFADPTFSFSQIANEIGMTNSTFTRAFQKHTGMLPIEYLVELRVEYAKELLQETELPVVDVAEAVGYYSVSSFSKRFKTVTGITPSEYRLQHKSQQ